MSVEGISAVMRGFRRICLRSVLALPNDDPVFLLLSMQRQAAILGQGPRKTSKPIGLLTLNSPASKTV